MKHVVIFVTSANKKEAKKIAKALIKKRLAACVNLVDKIESLFWWKGRVDSAKEILLVIKSTQSKVAEIIKRVKLIHSYEVPEIIVLPIKSGYKPYLDWIDDSVR